MSRILRWGGGYNGGKLEPFLSRIKTSSFPVKIDRWKLHCVPLTADEIEKMDEEYYKSIGKKKKPHKVEKEKSKLEEINMVVNNYFSVGIGAQIIEDFDTLRNKHPTWISSRIVGKGWYGALSLKRMVKPGTSVNRIVTAFLDGKKLDIPSKVLELTVLNIPSIMGGADFWGKYTITRKQAFVPTICDNYFELVGLKGLSHMARIKAGVAPKGAMRLGQGKHLVLNIRKTFNAQVDGEAILLPPCKIELSFYNQGVLLLNTHNDKSNKQRIKLVGMPK
eukprot:TRINITY_DN2243_c0_g1_i1.p1 TRINITY_DN2243_c0_g1~~TRINITY_DN2243_c0_g1_i1.p1  ORF type:complete len:326 (-),score=52.49 TRINITY_DN2243_c0_g1_i1:77-910(-)